jgi:hypothetical protein
MFYLPRSTPLQTDAVSGNTQMNTQLWAEFHSFRLEWELPQASIGDGASRGYVRWYYTTKWLGLSGRGGSSARPLSVSGANQ